MNTRSFIPILGLLAGEAFAEGLPLSEDRTRCEAPHLIINLNDEQREVVTVMGTLTLTRIQFVPPRGAQIPPADPPGLAGAAKPSQRAVT